MTNFVEENSFAGEVDGYSDPCTFQPVIIKLWETGEDGNDGKVNIQWDLLEGPYVHVYVHSFLHVHDRVHTLMYMNLNWNVHMNVLVDMYLNVAFCP